VNASTAEFFRDYARHRAKEGRAHNIEELKQLPYLREGPLARQWAVRARTFDAFVKHVIEPAGRPLAVLDLGAGNGWLSYRLARMGHRAVALDIRDDDVDGLGAAAPLRADVPFGSTHASFDDIPFATRRFDVTVFNASLHYAKDLKAVLAEAARVTRSRGILAVLDSPFYVHAADGEAMVAEKRAHGAAVFGARSNTLLSQNFIEYLTRERLAAAYPEHFWTRRTVRYPLWYEMRPLLAALKRARRPSRFDLWTARVP
jgi:ubiquinone/menaquinone biosynthesis C-methylase UbiE